MVQHLGLIESIRTTIGINQLELAFILGFLSDRANMSLRTRFIDLINTQEFGDGPTINEKLSKLTHSNYLETQRSQDHPEMFIIVTSEGLAWLRLIEEKLLMCSLKV